MRPGQLALFRPSATFTDYRLEFFGQIESKSMDWAVRARDAKNYYAMKFKVAEPGIRPVIASSVTWWWRESAATASRCR